ncbi:glycosyltransferase family 4 protein [Flavobacterium endoglycinae]|uniref:Glycosyltransferase family 4 protein n=2 Tax=Flavobacterium endoglycinae TaxID=2816357 RepID=A0ABX7Q9R8_9FLAO|nr:glycosyltransferase family 4 protein [Flavobacterium endoglycinae]
MRILMTAIPNHHFFQWVNQLENSGHEVCWFDITDGGPKVERIKWVNQIKGWKLRFDYPFRHTIKNKFPSLYRFIQKYNERNVQEVFRKILNEFQPDIVHCFEMKLAGLPILPIIEQYPNIKLIYSSWGSDLYFYNQLGLTKDEVQQFLTRTDYLITDCRRDYEIALQNDFKNTFLGVFPGNGGITLEKEFIKNVNERENILIKGYDDEIGKAIKIIEALELVPVDVIKKFKIIVYSTDTVVKKRIEESEHFNSFEIKIIDRHGFISNAELLKLMGNSIIHIANSISDGMPNVLLEAMGMGAFPIQSNPGKVAEEVLENGINGYLINDPLDTTAIAKLIESAVSNTELRKTAQEYNTKFIADKYNRKKLKEEILQLYTDVLSSKNNTK